MSANNPKIQSLIENTFVEAINKITSDDTVTMISDLYVQADSESGELQIYNENEKLINKTVIFAWVGFKEGEDKFNSQVIANLKAALSVLKAKDIFETTCFIYPFSVNYTDEGFSVIEEVLFIDDDMFRLDDPLLKDLDAELDNFLDKLLSDC